MSETAPVPNAPIRPNLGNDHAAFMNNESCLSGVILKVSDMVTHLFISIRDLFFTTMSCIPLMKKSFSNKAALSGLAKFVVACDDDNFFVDLNLDYQKNWSTLNGVPEGFAKKETQMRFRYSHFRCCLASSVMGFNRGPDIRAGIYDLVAKKCLKLTNEGCSENNHAPGSIRDLFFTAMSCIPLVGRFFSHKAALSGFAKFAAACSDDHFLGHLYLDYEKNRSALNEASDGSAKEKVQKRFEYSNLKLFLAGSVILFNQSTDFRAEFMRFRG